MFGVLKTSSAAWDPDLRREWVEHVCGTCLALGRAGQPYRFLTNSSLPGPTMLRP